MRQRQHDDEAAGAQRGAFRQRLDEHPAPPAGDVEAVHGGGEALVHLAQLAPGLEQAGIDARVGAQQEAAELRLPCFFGSSG